MNSLGDLISNLPLFRDALLCALFAGAMLGFLGVYVVLRRMVFASAAISQGAALGVALSFLMEMLFASSEHSLMFEPILWAVACGLLTTLVLTADPTRFRLTRESLLGLTYLFTGAGAVIVGQKITQESHDINSILFGSAVVVRHIDLVMVVAAAVAILVVQTVVLRATVFTSYDAAGARVAGLPVRLLNAILFVSIGLAVALATRALGALPVFGFSVLPAMAALALSDRLGVVFALAGGLGALCGVGGYAIAFVANLSVGATQTATMVVVMLAALGVRLLRRR